MVVEVLSSPPRASGAVRAVVTVGVVVGGLMFTLGMRKRAPERGPPERHPAG